LTPVNDQGNHASSQATDGGQLELELTAPAMGFAALVWSDYEAAQIEKQEPLWLARALYLPRLLLNPSLQFAFLVRLAQKAPRPLMFSCEAYKFHGEDGIVLGPGIAFPHPFCIIIGGGAKVGAGVTIYNNTMIGGNRHAQWDASVREAARLGDRSVVYSYSAIQGPYDVGQDAVVGIHVVLDAHVPPGALRSYRGTRLAGQWPGEERLHWQMGSAAQ
jgi:serine acetyltransferase